MDGMVKELLNKVTEINSKRIENERKTLSNFNIFDICNVTYDEVTICRFLSELLNPKGRHSQGIKYLKCFFENVLHDIDTPSDDELKNAIVMREEHIKNDRRIDISIFISVNKVKYYIPMEVKIDAGDQSEQCYDYYQHALSMNNNDKSRTKVWYLTINGVYPSANSLKDLNFEINNGIVTSCNEVQCISFKNEIYDFIIKCYAISEDGSYVSEKQVILQFKNAIERIIGGKLMNNEQIKSYIINDKKTFIAAKSIRDELQPAINIKLEEFLNLIFGYLEQKGWKTCEEYDNRLRNYMIPNCTYPAIYKDISIKGVDCELAVEVDYNGIPYFGLAVKDRNEKVDNINSIKLFVDNNKLTLEQKMQNEWIAWQYIPNKNEAPNFKYFNDSFYMLFDKELASHFVEICAKKIISYQEKIESLINYNITA